jgi:ribosome-associated protein
VAAPEARVELVLVAIAQLVERRLVVPDVAGSSPVGHPILVAGAVGGESHLLHQLTSSSPVSAHQLLCITYCLSSSMAEQRTLNPQVLGSNPRGGTSKTRFEARRFWQAEWMSDPEPVPVPIGLRVNSQITIPDTELTWRYSASGGPGGQHANTSNTRVELVFDVANSPSLTEAQRARIEPKLGSEIRVVVTSERSQHRNRVIARKRLAQQIVAALHVPRARRATKPSKGAIERRLQSKAKNSERKEQRRSSWD